MSPITRNTTAANILAAKDTNVPITISNTSTNGAAGKDAVVKGDFKTMEYHRQILQSKIEAQKYEVAAPYHKAVSELTQDRGSASNNYVSPSDEIMSPCTAKLSALRNKQVGKVKPKSLFAQASTKRLRGNEGLFGPKASTPSPDVDMGGL